MSTVQIYADETYGYKKSFLIQSVIWGDPGFCKLLNQAVTDIALKHSKVLGPGFKEFHAMNINQKNWKVFGIVYEEILDVFFEMVSKKNVGLLIVLMSKERFDNNAGYLTNIIKNDITNRASVFGKLFKSFNDDDLPAVYYRINQLFLLFKYRQFFGHEGDTLEYFPDSVGKVLHYVNRKFNMSGTLPISLPFDYLDIIRFLGDAYLRAFSDTFGKFEPGSFTTIHQTLGKFQPLDSSSSFIIQLCDIISNFTFAHICHRVGIPGKKFELKSGLINKYLDFDLFNPIIDQSFTAHNNEVTCTNPEIWGHIQATKK